MKNYIKQIIVLTIILFPILTYFVGWSLALLGCFLGFSGTMYMIIIIDLAGWLE